MKFETLKQEKRRKRGMKFTLFVAIIVTSTFLIGRAISTTDKQETLEQVSATIDNSTYVCHGEPPEIPDPDCDFYAFEGNQIQAILDYVENGATIKFENGKYTDVDIEIGLANHPEKKDIIIEGESLGTIFDGNDETDIFHIGGESKVSISQMTLQSGTNYAIASQDNSEIKIENLNIENNTNGVGAFNTSKLTLKNSFVNFAEGGYGVVLDDNSESIIENNVISNNSLDGITLFKQAKTFVTNNTFANNGDDGIDCGDSENINTRCQLTNNISINNADSGYTGSSREQVEILSFNLTFGNGTLNWPNIFSQAEINKAGNVLLDPNIIDEIFHTDKNSSAKNLGALTIINPDGSRSDIGAYGGPGACNFDNNLYFCK